MILNKGIRELYDQTNDYRTPNIAKNSYNKIHESMSLNTNLSGRNQRIDYSYSSNPLLFTNDQKGYQNNNTNKINIKTMDVVYSQKLNE